MLARWLSISNVLVLTAVCVFARTPTQDGVVYGEAAGETLTMDYYAPSGAGPHPVAIIIHGGGFVEGTSKNGSEAYCADFLAPADYAVFSINYRLAPKYPYPAMVHDVERAVRFIRHHASKWSADPSRIALVGGSAGGYLSNMAGLLNAPGDKSAADPVDRESARRRWSRCSAPAISGVSRSTNMWRRFSERSFERRAKPRRSQERRRSLT